MLEGLTTYKLPSHFLVTALLISRIYFLGQNIIFANGYSPYFRRDILATGSVLTIMGGIIQVGVLP